MEDYNQYENFGNQMNHLIHISLRERRGRIPNQFDLKKIVKFWKQNFNCLGSIVKENADAKDKQKDNQQKDQKNEDKIIKISGDKRKEVEQFLIHMGICHKDNIRIQGK